MTRQRPPERVEMITGDPRAFGAAPLPSSASLSSPASPPAQSARSRKWMVVGGAVVVALVVALVWPRSTRHPIAASTTTAPAVVTSPNSLVSVSTNDPSVPEGRPVVALEGRPSPTPLDVSTVGLRLEVFPLQIPLGTPVSVRLEGDLTRVGPMVAALVWLDRSVNGGWQTVAWIAQAAPGVQVSRDVSVGLDTGPSPDAITVRAGDAFGVDLDLFAAGTYRVCRYVPIAATAVTAPDATVPIDNPVYLCAPINLT